MSRLKKGLALVLTLCMMLSLMPVITPSSQAANGDDFYKIVHLDCGRKYFTVDWIKGLIDEMAKDGYTHLELAFGNDGLRFLLDDMSVTANDTTYTSDVVKAGIQAGNKAYYDFGTNELTEDEMNDIIAHANTKGIEIIPLLNTPGHMDAIITCMANLGIDGDYNGSVRTVDVTNSTAVAFTQALVNKYIQYFAGKDCTVFNIGADEYANDIYSSGSMGFGQLVNRGQYGLFIQYVNDLAALVKAANMTPMAFNDGFYFNGNTTSGTFDTDIMISFWTSGWSGYKSETAEQLAGRGHKLVNTHGDFYYVLGKTDSWDNNGSSYAASWDNAKFMGTTFDSEQAGSMFCIWCDYPNAETENEIYTKVVESGVLAAMSEAMGHMPESGGSTDPKDVTVTDNGVSVTAPGLTSIEVKEQQAVTSGNTVSQTYSITLNGGAYKGEATVRIPCDSAFDNCMSFTGTVDGTPFPVKKEGNDFVATVPHFSDVTITGTLADTGDDPRDTVTSVGGTPDSYVLDANGLDSGARYLIVYQTSSSATSGKALNTSKGSLDVTISGDNATPSGDAGEALWTYSTKRGGWGSTDKYFSNGSNYLYPNRSGRYNKYTYDLKIDSTEKSIIVENKSNGVYTIASDDYISPGYVNYSNSNNAWTASSSSQNLYFYKYTAGTANYKVAPALQESRITALTVTNDGYTDDSWNAYQNALTAANTKLSEVKAKNYTSEDAANDALGELISSVDALENAKNNLKKTVTITINYQTENGTTVKTETKKVAEGTAAIELSNVTGTDGKTYVPTDTSLSLVNGQTEYTVTVTEMPFDPSTVSPLTIEYWITNGRPTDADGSNSYSVSAGTAYSQEGVDISTLLPVNTTKESRTLQYWRGRLLDTTKTNSSTSGTEKQTEDSGDDETYNGVEFTKVRYWNGNWEVYTENNAWVTVTSNHQLVAYYLEILPVSDELRVTAADWGKKGDGSTSGDYLEPSSSCTVSVQVVYEDGTTNPATTTAADLASTTIAYGYWSSGRGIGTLNLGGLEGYQIWKIEAETGAETYDAYNSSTWGNYTVSSFTWDNNAMTVYEGDPVDSYIIHNDAHDPSEDGYYANLMWDENHEAILIKVYVKAPVTEDSLTVHYLDRTANDAEFYSYNISVASGTTFNSGFALVENYTSIDNALTGNTVINILGVTQSVTANLGKLSEIGVQYRYSYYTCVQVTRSEDGKDVYLYYTFNNAHNFVIDFGLPLTITRENLNIDGDWTSATVTNATYGTVAKNDSTQAVTYTPNRVLLGVDSFNLTLAGSNGSVTHTIYIYPATTVYYEEGFATYYGNWTSTGNTGSGEQQTAKAGQVANATAENYGYDAAYVPENYVGPSNDTQAASSAPNGTKNYATFTFTGTGVDVYANCTTQDAKLMIGVYQGTQTDSPLQVISVNTKMENGSGSATAGQKVNAYNVPVASVTGLDYGEYTLKIIHVKVNNSTTGDAVNLDGFRVYDTLDPDSSSHKDGGVYYNDQEDNPIYIELRDQVLASLNAESTDSEKYADQIAKNTLSQVYSTANSTKGAVIITNASAGYSEEQLTDLLDNGPKNEIYLQPQQSLTFSINTTRVAQIGLKALNVGTTCTIKVGDEILEGWDGKSLNSSTDMFYKVLDKNPARTSAQSITITNTGSGILSITKLKICDDPNATLGTLTAEDLIPALVSLGFETTSNGSGGGGGGSSTPAEPTEPTTPPSGTGLPFTDVTTGDWFLENVKYVYEKGLMNGTSDTTFSPKQTTNRAMIVTILHRLENSPAVDAQSPFADVAADQYYANPVAWAAANGIVTGTSETTFAPLNNITREQMAAILYRYAQFKGYDVSVGEDTNILSYADAETISEYAVPAIQWAVGAGLINGKGGGVLDPQGSATRAEVSAILARFCEAYAK